VQLGGDTVTERGPDVPGGFAPGSRIASYLLGEQIGRGGMAVVFRAYDERLDRMVALKILDPALAEDEVFRQRFIRESRAAAATDDPHIIPVFDAGEASGALFIAMRLVSGGDVRSLLGQSGPLPPGRAAEIVSQVASALDAAHERGLVHRDVKPANMLLDGTSGAGRPDHVYLSDFGLSVGSLQNSGLTGKGTFLGTIDYISPEQIEGKLVDGRADQYALACAAFEILTGTPPFWRDEARAVMYAQLTEPPPALSSYRAGLPLGADAVFTKALAKAPQDRFASCQEFAEALRAAFGLRPFDSGPGEVPILMPPVDQGVPGASQAATIIGPGSGPSGDRGAFGPGSGPGGDRGAFGSGADPNGAGEAQLNASSPGQTSRQLTPPHWLLGGGAGGQYGGQYGGDASAGSSRRKSTLAIIVAVAVVVVLVAGAAAVIGLTGKSDSSGGSGTQLHQVVLQPPDCIRAAAPGPQLHPFPAIRVPAGTGGPFGVAVSADGKAVFAVTDSAVKVYRASDGTLTYTGKSYPVGSSARPATTAVVTRDGRYLLVASDNGIKVLDAVAAEQGSGHAILGTLSVPGLTKYGRAVGVAVTPDDKYAFVSLQFRDEVGVFSLAMAIRERFRRGLQYYLGALNVGPQPVGLTMSPDGETLYATAFRGNSAVPGTLSVVDVVRATSKDQLASAVISRVQTGCEPARVAVSADGKTVWVTARESNYLLGYSAAALRHHPADALIAKVQVGTQPIGVALVNGGKRIVVSDDNNTTTPPQAGTLAVVDTGAALRHKPALLGYIPAGLAPHELAVSPDGRFLYVSDYLGFELQLVSTGKLP
jgi:serine/threonine protein kinase/DNA-binding beta-propeller fold protein YncE